MTNSVTFYYDFLSPYSYLAFSQLEGLQARTQAEISLKPIFVLGVMKEVGNVPTTITCQAKGAYAFQDLARWAQQYNVPMNRHPRFGQFSSEPLLLGALAAEARGQVLPYTAAIFDGIWKTPMDVDTDDGAIACLDGAGVPGAAEIWAAREDFKYQLAANNASAVTDGVFGVPSFKTASSLYFGNDRMSFLEKELSQ